MAAGFLIAWSVRLCWSDKSDILCSMFPRFWAFPFNKNSLRKLARLRVESILRFCSRVKDLKYSLRYTVSRELCSVI